MTAKITKFQWATMTGAVVAMLASGMPTSIHGEPGPGLSAYAWRGPSRIAAGDGYAGPWRMNRSRFYYVDDPSVDLDRDAGIGIAWVDNRAQNVLFQHFDSEMRRAFDTPVDVSRSPGTFSWLPKVVMSGDGESVFVLWQEIVFSGGTHGGETFFSRSVDGGRTFFPPVNLSNSPAGDGKGRLTGEYWHNGSLDIALGPDGTVYTAWTEYEGALWFRRSTDGGAHFEAPVRVSGSEKSPARGPDFGIGPDGTVYLAWAVGEDPAADIQLAVSDDGGRSFSDPRAPFESDGHSDAPKIAVDAENGVHLVYAESPSGMFRDYHVRYARLEPGARVSQPARLLAGPRPGEVRSTHYPGLDVSDESVYVIWERFLPDERRPRGLGFTMSQDGGETFTPPSVIPDTDNPEYGSNGGLQGLLMQKIAVNQSGAVAVVNSRFKENEASRIRLIRGKAPVR